MPRRLIGRTLIVLPVLLLAYLGVAALWAWGTVDQLVAAYPEAAPGAALSARQQQILLKIEDPAFFRHKGISLADGQGVTTISSAIARQVFLSGGALAGMKGALQRFYRGVFACCKRVDIGRDVMALVLDAKVAKQRQLDLYSAHVYMGTHRGQQVKGLEQASRLYFARPLGQLDEAGFISLVAMIKAPNQFHPITEPRAFALRRERVAQIVSGACRPAGWFDTSYEGCNTGFD